MSQRSWRWKAGALVPQSGLGSVVFSLPVWTVESCGRVWVGHGEAVTSRQPDGLAGSGGRAGGAGATADVSLPFSVLCSHLDSNSTSTLTAAISNTSYSSSSPIELLFSSNNQISSPPESSGYSEELCTFL